MIAVIGDSLEDDALKFIGQSCTVLKLNGNKLVNIHANAFSSLSVLLELDLSNNLLERVNLIAFTALSALTTLNLSHNLFTILSPEIKISNERVLHPRDPQIPIWAHRYHRNSYQSL